MNGRRNPQRFPVTGYGRPYSLSPEQELTLIRREWAELGEAVAFLEQEDDNLRRGVHELKLENARIRQKLKAMQQEINALSGEAVGMKIEPSEAYIEYEDIGRDFILVGGIHDPFSLAFEAPFRDETGLEHKSAERYYWYKMAEHFGDSEAMAKVMDAPAVVQVQEAVKGIKDFDEAKWNEVKMSVWEAGQRLKVEQTRWISNLLVYTGKTYIAVASEDKVFGTGWRKSREESSKPIFWEGENLGGKMLMKLRYQIKETHSWSGPYEEEETKKSYEQLKKFVWRRIGRVRRPRVTRNRSGVLGVLTGGDRGAHGKANFSAYSMPTPSVSSQSQSHSATQ